ncbi:MAG: ligase 1 [Miltoncostaeaceae bacterium]|nr:ligase 1 [Miltoncostaeaceae bacterium]
MLLRELVEASERVGGTPSRLAKVELLAGCLRRLAPEEAAAGVAFLAGELRQRQIGVGWAALRELPPPAHSPGAPLAVIDVDRAFEAIGASVGAGSQGRRRALLADLFGRATGAEAAFLRRLLGGDLRQGALAGVMVDAVARAAGLPEAEVRRALMLGGSLTAVGAAALERGAEGLAGFRLEVGRPLQPMLAQPAADLDDALERAGPSAIEWKLDGARIQAHRADDEVRVFTRTLDDITERLPEVVRAVLALPVRTAVLDGEVIALRDDGRPQPFQVTASRVGRRRPDERLQRARPLTPFVFDLLHLDGEDLLDRPTGERAQALEEVARSGLRVPRLVPASPAEAEAFLAGALARGHEGAMVKSLDAPYAAGRRGGGWLKVKPHHVLDLVVLAAEWGHGRRRGWLSNLHLGAGDPGGGSFAMLGKTFKGLTDEMLVWQTRRLLELEVARDDWTVHVRPELVVEVAFEGVQRSARYQAGMALRFARVRRFRPDKRADEADPVHAVRAIFAGAGGTDA